MTEPPTVADEAEAASGSRLSQTPLRRSRDHKVISGVCGGLGRYCDLDPVIFRVVLSVLSVAGGLGLIVYGFCWLLIPFHGEDENEGRRLLSGRVEGPGLTAVLVALVGCGLFLSMLNNGGVMYFSFMLALAAAGAGYWSHHRRQAESVGAVDAATAQAVADAPPETKAPPTRGGPSPSWWRDPIVKDGTTGPLGAGAGSRTGYLWGPDDGPYDKREAKAERARRVPDRASIGGWAFLVAVAAAVVGARARWSSQPLGTSLEIGFACALGVFGLALVISSRWGRAGGGTVFLALLTSALLAGAAALPDAVTPDWARRTWAPTSVASLRDGYELGGGVAELKLDRLPLEAGDAVSSRVEMGAGKLAVTVPRDARVRLDIQVGIGDIWLPGEKRDKHNVDIGPDRERKLTLEPTGGGKAEGTVSLKLEMGLGAVEVRRS
ncbi:PspC domain-containing protein [Streptomyces sp. RCU064]|uniref:PspC domain-containing protein n=2 Tax=Streptomyces rugosispiralis TaxID=2967341 RepID=A0ABT1UVY5_9ACTN|nr:PspC domain-containing protein [Streptomyces rugosispiralis]MCQ8189202.1 PspC domain-containing protein [Streptomyces rugosispiralis]